MMRSLWTMDIPVWWRYRHNANNRVFYLKRKNNTHALNNWNKHFYWNDSKGFHTTQNLKTYNEGTTQTNAFWILAETFIHTIYIRQHQHLVHRLKMKTMIASCTKETTQTTTFWIWAKIFMHIINNLQRHQPAKTLISLCKNETTQTTIFSIDNKNALT